ncbi:hypothetical protein LSM04_000299 [Trypanosoma melophagium]|uniref:uncharacterized protein n=1 Tax=Trypanosoma melophagium TaxID=715481 RepID=UPI00351A321E|nr:hypothetical protein LSM04_000299 [Trypanosoma melophagium]
MRLLAFPFVWSVWDVLCTPAVYTNLASTQTCVPANSTDKKKNNKKSNNDDVEDDRPVLTNSAAAGGSGGRVGMKLLQEMHKAPSCYSSFISTSAVAKSQNLCVVEDYTPLSVGGFMATAAETIMNSADSVRPGDIMCLRCPPPRMTRHFTVNSVSPSAIAVDVASSSSGSPSAIVACSL